MTFRVKGIDIHSESHIYVTIANHTESHKITKTGSDLTVTVNGSDTDVALTLTQNESKIFRPNTKGWGQVNWTDANGDVRGATDTEEIIFKNNLLKELIPNV